jgi:hypothetical protein
MRGHRGCRRSGRKKMISQYTLRWARERKELEQFRGVFEKECRDNYSRPEGVHALGFETLLNLCYSITRNWYYDMRIYNQIYFFVATHGHPSSDIYVLVLKFLHKLLIYAIWCYFSYYIIFSFFVRQAKAIGLDREEKWGKKMYLDIF